MLTYVFGAFGLSTLWFLPLLWRLLKSLLHRDVEQLTAPHGPARFWGGALAVLLSSTALEGLLVWSVTRDPASGAAVTRWLGQGLSQHLGTGISMVLMLAILLAALPSYLGFCWQDMRRLAGQNPLDWVLAAGEAIRRAVADLMDRMPGMGRGARRTGRKRAGQPSRENDARARRRGRKGKPPVRKPKGAPVVTAQPAAEVIAPKPAHRAQAGPVEPMISEPWLTPKRDTAPRPSRAVSEEAAWPSDTLSAVPPRKDPPADAVPGATHSLLAERPLRSEKGRRRMPRIPTEVRPADEVFRARGRAPDPIAAWLDKPLPERTALQPRHASTRRSRVAPSSAAPAPAPAPAPLATGRAPVAPATMAGASERIYEEALQRFQSQSLDQHPERPVPAAGEGIPTPASGPVRTVSADAVTVQPSRPAEPSTSNLAMPAPALPAAAVPADTATLPDSQPAVAETPASPWPSTQATAAGTSEGLSLAAPRSSEAPVDASALSATNQAAADTSIASASVSGNQPAQVPATPTEPLQASTAAITTDAALPASAVEASAAAAAMFVEPPTVTEASVQTPPASAPANEPVPVITATTAAADDLDTSTPGRVPTTPQAVDLPPVPASAVELAPSMAQIPAETEALPVAVSASPAQVEAVSTASLVTAAASSLLAQDSVMPAAALQPAAEPAAIPVGAGTIEAASPVHESMAEPVETRHETDSVVVDHHQLHDHDSGPTLDVEPGSQASLLPHPPIRKATAPLPPLDLLSEPPAETLAVDEEQLAETGALIEQRLREFKVPVSVVGAGAGPVITRFEVEPAVGVRGNQVVALMKDLARGLGRTSIRVVETIPGKTCMGLELPNEQRQMIALREILDSAEYRDSDSLLTLAMGKGITGEPVVADLAKAPHMLVAGTTGSGKSVAVNAMILSMLYKATPEQVRLIMIDPKMLELSVYEGIPHLLAPVVTDMKLAANALAWCVGEMENRYRLMSELRVRNLAGFNQKVREAREAGKPLWNPYPAHPEVPEYLDTLPMIVVVIDELADLMMVAGKKIEELIARLAQKARAAGIHLILATQRPSVDVITGLIKANIPTRVAFQVSSKIDSRTILDQMGAESLLGQGDMLFMPPGTGYPNRVHGAFVADEEVLRVVAFLKQFGEPDYIDDILAEEVGEAPADGNGDAANAEADPLYDEAAEFVLKTRRASISFVQRQFRIGYNRAARLVEAMEAAGLVSSMGPNGQREVLAPGRDD